MAALPDLVNQLQAGGSDATAAFSQDELETVIDDLPLALESEAMRAALPDLVGRIDRRQQRTFRRIIEIARQDEERIPLLLAALRQLPWNGSPTEDEFAWLISQLNRIDDETGPRDAFERMCSLTLHAAQVSMLDALATSHYDEQIRRLHAERRNKAPGRELTAEMVEDSARRAEAPTVAAAPVAEAADALPEPSPQAEALAEAQAEPMDWGEEKPPERLTVRTLLRSLEPAVNLAGGARPETVFASPPLDASAVAAADDAGPVPEAVAETAAEAVPEPVADAQPEAEAEAALSRGDYEVTPPPPEEPAPIEATAAAPESVWDEAEGTAPPRVTVRTLLRSLDTVRVEMPPPIPGEEPVPPLASPEPDAQSAAMAGETASEEDDGAGSVMGMLRSLDTVRVSLMDLEAAKMSIASGATAPAAAARKPDAPPSPWAALDLTAQSPPERARRLSRARRELTTPEQRRHYLTWLLQKEDDTAFGPSIRKELLEFAFERPVFLGFDGSTRGRLGRWIRDRAAGEAIPAAAVLAALRRAMWSDGEPPVVDDEIRPLVDAASGCLMRATADERLPLLGRDFSVWLFAVREIEDREPLDKWARDPQPAVVEGVFRALAAMDALAARVGGTGDGPTALQLALGVWDRADSETRLQMAHGIAAGWSRGFVLDRASFFEAFWRRAKENPVQSEPVMIALASFDKELEAERAKARAAEPKPPEPPKAEPPKAASPKPAIQVEIEAEAEPVPAPWEAAPVPAQPEIAPTDPLARPEALTNPSPFAEDVDSEVENTTDRYFRTKREEIERSMRPSGAPPAPVAAPARAEARVDVGASARMDARVAEADDEQTEDEFDAIPDEGDDVLSDDSVDDDPDVAARRRGKTNPGIRVTPRALNAEPATAPGVAPAPAAAAPAPAPVAPKKAPAPEDEVVLPHEPLRTLGEYTAFLKALSAGSPIDELLDRHGMDYKQYAACMTAWGKVLQGRPELALRMGQLLRS